MLKHYPYSNEFYYNTKYSLNILLLSKDIKERNLDVSENVDIILQYNNREGFYELIILKDKGFPYNNPNYKIKAVNKPTNLMNF